MRNWSKTKSISCALVTTTRRLDVRANLAPVIDAFLAEPTFAPAFWGRDERSALPFSKDEVLAQVPEEASAKPPSEFYLFRKGEKKFPTVVTPWARGWVTLDANPATPESEWEALFALADRLARAMEPDFATTHIGPDYAFPPVSPADVAANQMAYGVAVPVSYKKLGPRGLCMRTYFGPKYVEQLGKELLLATPAVVKELPWGGVRIDLVERPWEAPIEALSSAWQAAMAHLRPAGVLAERTARSDGFVDFVKGAHCSIPKGA